MLIQSSIYYTNTILDFGENQTISNIMKQQTIERGREVINHAMDIHAGSAICLGENNFIEKFIEQTCWYNSEGSNTLTKNLIAFGQGLNKSHPFIFPVYQSILEDNYNNFKGAISELISHYISCYKESISKL